MKKEFPIHSFMTYCPEYGDLKVKPDAPVSIRRSLKFGYSRGKNGTEYGVVRFCIQSPNYKLSEKQMTHLAWKLQTGDWPSATVRFIDGNHKNLKWENLRQDSKNA